jgi:hypothetical protein
VYTLVLNTLAHIDPTAVVYAIGSVLVNANDDTLCGDGGRQHCRRR